jgi:predicted MFS family arabinose efflux permease
MINFGAAIGPIIGAFMGTSSSPIGFALTGSFYLFYSAWNAFLLKDLLLDESNLRKTSSLTRAIGVLSADRRLRYFVLAGALFMACYSQLESNLSQHLIREFENGATLFSTMLSLNGICVIIFQAPVYFFSKKITPTKSLIIGSTLFSVGLMLIGLAETKLIWIYAGMILVSLGEIFVFPVSSYFVDSISPENLRGTYFGASVLRQLGLSLGPAAGGLILNTLGGKGLFLTASVVAAAGILVHLQGEKLGVHRQTQEEAYG